MHVRRQSTVSHNRMAIFFQICYIYLTFTVGRSSRTRALDITSKRKTLFWEVKSTYPWSWEYFRSCHGLRAKGPGSQDRARRGTTQVAGSVSRLSGRATRREVRVWDNSNYFSLETLSPRPNRIWDSRIPKEVLIILAAAKVMVAAAWELRDWV